MKLLILSDLHLDVAPMALEHEGWRIDRDADLVVLAGDIDEGTRGLRWARASFPDKPIVYVAGNHEFYGQHWRAHLDVMRQKAEQLEIAFLENQVLEYGGIRFLGCSLWTDFALYGAHRKQDSMQAAQAWLNDYRQILVRDQDIPQEMYGVSQGTLVPELTVYRHLRSAEWLEQELAAGDPDRTVVVTHHAPLDQSIPDQFVGDALSPAYASNLSRLLGRSKLWIHGHVHDNVDYAAGRTRVICNPRGYPDFSGDSVNEDFNLLFTVEV